MSEGMEIDYKTMWEQLNAELGGDPYFHCFEHDSSVGYSIHERPFDRCDMAKDDLHDSCDIAKATRPRRIE